MEKPMLHRAMALVACMLCSVSSLSAAVELSSGSAVATDARSALLQKGFSAEWIDSLTPRGQPCWYEGRELRCIGLPVGGLFAGQIYLGGDGRLWYWDVFNQRLVEPYGPGDKFYNEPMQPDRYRPVQSGFVLELAGRAVLIDARGFHSVWFRGEYPIGRVRLSDPAVPLGVELEAFSPFCPTNTADSSIPATILCYTLTNRSPEPVTFRVGGWLENATNRREVERGSLRPTCAKIAHAAAVLLTDAPTSNASPEPQSAPDSGTMALAPLGREGTVTAPDAVPATWRSAVKREGETIRLDAAVLRTEPVTLKPGRTAEVRFAICWHFANAHLGTLFPRPLRRHAHQRNYYAKRYADAAAVAHDLLRRHDELVRVTRLWRDTWYDSTLPLWFLDRTFINVSTLATTAALRMQDAGDRSLDGRVYFWEGVYLGPGTCTHVTHYEQAFGRLFPEAARAQRHIVDYGVGWDDRLGYIRYRAELDIGHHFGIPHAIDGHAGTILRTYREHTLAADDSFLRSVWPRVRRAVEFMIDQDGGRGFFEKYVPAADRDTQPDGILSGPQYNTLDKVWDGTIAWTSGLYQAALRAAARMAAEMGDADFARQCDRIADIGRDKLAKATFNSQFGYFVQRPVRQDKYVNSNDGCHIDQMLGDYWTYQLGLEQVFPSPQACSALHKLFEHNFRRRIGQYRDKALIKVSRFYADDDEPGTVICSFPHGGARRAAPSGGGKWDNLVTGYFSECWTGTSYALAAHMISRGMVTEGLAVCRAIHDRYAEAPRRRNPFNEIEYGNHYTRAMSGYAPFLAICGFSYHGPKGEIGFAPRMRADNFRSAFTAAEGWGTYLQRRGSGRQSHLIQLAHGRLKLTKLKSTLSDGIKVTEVNVKHGHAPIVAQFTQRGTHLAVTLPETLTLHAGETLSWTARGE